MRIALAIAVLAAVGLGLYGLYLVAKRRGSQSSAALARARSALAPNVRNRFLLPSGGQPPAGAGGVVIDDIDPALIEGDFGTGADKSALFPS